jgi:hypothetical protein
VPNSKDETMKGSQVLLPVVRRALGPILQAEISAPKQPQGADQELYSELSEPKNADNVLVWINVPSP